MKTSNAAEESVEFDHVSFWIGLALAVSSSVFIGASFVIKKLALRRLAASGGVRAAAGGYSYLRQGLWWLGFLTMGAGEAANLLAYGFAPAALVTPLGALSVLVAAVLAARVLGERPASPAACLLCALGAAVLVLHAPHAGPPEPFAELLGRLLAPPGLAALGGALLLAGGARAAERRWARRHVAVYLLLCAALGAITVQLCRAAAVGARQALAGDGAVLAAPGWWLLVLAAAGCVAVQMTYLNRSLDLFGASLVTPVYYVLFTALAVLGSAVMFEEWRALSGRDAAGAACGFAVSAVAVFMLSAEPEGARLADHRDA